MVIPFQLMDAPRIYPLPKSGELFGAHCKTGAFFGLSAPEGEDGAV
jgi:hypothetical protein